MSALPIAARLIDGRACDGGARTSQPLNSPQQGMAMTRILLATCLVLMLAACGGGGPDEEPLPPTMTTLPVDCAHTPSPCR